MSIPQELIDRIWNRALDLDGPRDADAAAEQEELAANEDDDIDDEALDEAGERIDAMYHLEASDVEEALVMVIQRDPEAFAPTD